MNNHKLRELARQAGFNVDSDGNISLYGGGCKLLLRPNYQATVADGIKLLVDLAIKEERNAWENKLKEQESKCNPHTKAPHGFNRNASHANDRYTCECEGWDAYDAGYQAGVMAGIEASMGEPEEPEQEPVAWAENDGDGNVLWNRESCFSDDPEWLDNPMPLYTTPPQRKPLTDKQREEIAKGWRGRNWTLGDIIDAVEAAHGIKE